MNPPPGMKLSEHDYQMLYMKQQPYNQPISMGSMNTMNPIAPINPINTMNPMTNINTLANPYQQEMPQEYMQQYYEKKYPNY